MLFFLLVYFFERTRPAASMRPPWLIYLPTSKLPHNVTQSPEYTIIARSNQLKCTSIIVLLVITVYRSATRVHGTPPFQDANTRRRWAKTGVLLVSTFWNVNNLAKSTEWRPIHTNDLLYKHVSGHAKGPQSPRSVVESTPCVETPPIVSTSSTRVFVARRPSVTLGRVYCNYSL